MNATMQFPVQQRVRNGRSNLKTLLPSG